jgi:hypothetical protein
MYILNCPNTHTPDRLQHLVLRWLATIIALAASVSPASTQDRSLRSRQADSPVKPESRQAVDK